MARPQGAARAGSWESRQRSKQCVKSESSDPSLVPATDTQCLAGKLMESVAWLQN